MRNIFQLLTVMLGGALLFSCEIDNFDAPDAMLEGRIVFEGEPINVEWGRVSYELFQDGFGRVGAIGSSFTQDGEFSHLLFDGEYKMIIPIGQGPFLPLANSEGNADTILINLRGTETLDVEVTPYWMLRGTQLSAGEGSVGATFGLDQIVMGDDAREVENVTLYISKTAFANSQTNVARSNINGNSIEDFDNISLSVEIPDLQPTQSYVYASVGVKFAGVEDLIFSDTERLDF